MAAFNKFNAFTEDVAEKVHNLGADVLKIMLSNTAPTSTNAVLVDIIEIAAVNGYTAGGSALTVTSSAQSSGVYKLVANDLVFTASGGAFGPFRYAVLYNSTTASGNLIGWWDYGSSISLNSGETFTIDLDQTNGVFTIT